MAITTFLWGWGGGAALDLLPLLLNQPNHCVGRFCAGQAEAAARAAAEREEAEQRQREAAAAQEAERKQRAAAAAEEAERRQRAAAEAEAARRRALEQQLRLQQQQQQQIIQLQQQRPAVGAAVDPAWLREARAGMLRTAAGAGGGDAPALTALRGGVAAGVGAPPPRPPPYNPLRADLRPQQPAAPASSAGDNAAAGLGRQHSGGLSDLSDEDLREAGAATAAPQVLIQPAGVQPPRPAFTFARGPGLGSPLPPTAPPAHLREEEGDSEGGRSPSPGGGGLAAPRDGAGSPRQPAAWELRFRQPLLRPTYDDDDDD